MFTDPVKNLKALGLRESDIVVDLGAGTGFYSIAAAKIVTQGKVYSIEVQKDYLMTIGEKARDAGVGNVECLWGDIEKIGGTKIGNNIADACLVSNVLSQLEEKEKFVEETKRILKPSGKVLLVDWSDSSTFPLKNIIQKDKARAMFEKSGFVFERDIDAGEHHYGMILMKQ